MGGLQLAFRIARLWLISGIRSHRIGYVYRNHVARHFIRPTDTHPDERAETCHCNWADWAWHLRNGPLAWHATSMAI